MNKPYISEQVKALPKGLNITRALIGVYGGVSYYHPNRSESRRAIYGKQKPNNRKNKLGGRLMTRQVIPVHPKVEENGITKFLYHIISFFKGIFHKKYYQTLNYVR